MVKELKHKGEVATKIEYKGRVYILEPQGTHVAARKGKKKQEDKKPKTEEGQA